MNWVKGAFQIFFSEEKEKEEEVVVQVPQKRERRDPCNGRDTPIDLLGKGSFRIAHVKDAMFTVNKSMNELTVNLPKKGSKTKRKEYVMPLQRDVASLAEAIKEEMEYDGFETMDSVRLAAEYPFFFWNGMFHCLGRIHVLDALLKKNGIEQKRKRRKMKRGVY